MKEFNKSQKLQMMMTNLFFYGFLMLVTLIEVINVIITIGSAMGDATASKAKSYPDVKFAIADNAYAISGLANVTSLMFAEDQVGFLAGGMAGGMSRSGFVFSVSSIQNSQSDR